MLRFAPFMLGMSLLAHGASSQPVWAEAMKPCGPDALGTSRDLAIGRDLGVAVGLKTYPQTLTLEDHEVVLTFDDGPFPPTTSKILDALANECVHATFFLIGRNAEANPALVRRQVAEGHTIGHHSHSHPSLTLRNLSDAAARADIDRGIKADDLAAYKSADAAPRVPFFRFPGFADTPALNQWLISRGITIFGADLWASDWIDMTPQAELELILRRLEQARRGIILFHDPRPSTAEMMPNFLRELKTRGYKVVHLVPGGGETPTIPAPQGWNSETEATLKKMWPKGPAAARAAAMQRKARHSKSIKQELPQQVAEPSPGTE
jgi:peptidoglycan/xylan/chitin deacetylase (PgdA/CDA1 family)